MTVCIAAIYKETQPDGSVSDRIVMATDWQLTDEKTGRASDVGFKLHRLNAVAIALGSGDMDTFNTISQQVERRLKGSLNYLPIDTMVDTYLEVETEYRQKFDKRNNIGKAKSKSIPVPCLPDVIIAGFDGEKARLWKITPPEQDGIAYPPDERTKKGWAIIGEGEELAEQEFLQGLSVPYFGKAQTLFLCYLAKKRAEHTVSVGKTTLLSIFTPPFDWRTVNNNVTEKFERAWQTLEKQELECKQRSYDKARDIIAKAEEAGPITRKREDEE